MLSRVQWRVIRTLISDHEDDAKDDTRLPRTHAASLGSRRGGAAQDFRRSRRVVCPLPTLGGGACRTATKRETDEDRKPSSLGAKLSETGWPCIEPETRLVRTDRARTISALRCV